MFPHLLYYIILNNFREEKVDPPLRVFSYQHYLLTFLGWTLGISSEYLSTRYDSADDRIIVVKTTTMTTTNSEIKEPEYWTDEGKGMTLLGR